jgi:beta-phosphoglucomutase-like phosphatase (HAD superfamily)
LIGSCSGYPRPVMEKLVPAAAAQGYAPDHWVATDHIPACNPSLMPGAASSTFTQWATSSMPRVITFCRLKIGSCSGYPRPVMEKLVPAAAAQGYAPDHWVATTGHRQADAPHPGM